MSGAYIGDFTGDETLTVTFDTFDSNGASITLSGSPSFSLDDIAIYKAASMTQRTSNSGWTLLDTDGIDLDGVVGIHGFTVDLSDDTDSGFYAAGNDYYVTVTGVTIDTQVVSFIAARFSIQNRASSLVRYALDHLIAASVTGTDVTDNSIVAQIVSASATADWDDYDNTVASLPAIQDDVGSLSVGSAAISTQVESYTLTTGTQSSGTYTDTVTLNSVYHEHTDSAGTIDLYYQADVGGAGTAVNFTFTGRLNGSNDSLTIQAYDWSGASWDDVFSLQGINGATDTTESVNLLTRHTGSGADLGKVRLRFYGTGLTSATLYVDQIYVSYAVVSQSVGYALGAVWLDTNVSNTNTEAFVDGVADNPVSTLAAANTLLTNTSLRTLQVLTNSSITLAAAQENIIMDGHGWVLALGGQSINGSHIMNAEVSGISTAATDAEFHDCEFDSASVQNTHFYHCGFGATLTMTLAGNYNYIDCYSMVAGASSPIYTKTLGQAITAQFRRYSGGIDIRNLESGDIISIEGHGQLIIDSSCTGGTIAIRGVFRVTDNASGAVNLVLTTPVIDQVHQGTAQAATANTITLAATASTTDGQYDPGRVLIVAGTGAGQSREIIDYNGTTKVAVVAKDWRTNPDTTSSYVVTASSGALHVNEGLAQAGAASTVTLNTSGSATDDVYVGQTIFLVAGTGQDQSRIITAYNGTTKVATVHKAWGVTPDATSSYVMLPLPAIGDYVVNATPELVADAVWDEVLTAATHNVPSSAGRRLRTIQEFQGYFGGCVWIDTINGTAGTVDYENGIVELPVDSLADARTIALSLGYNCFEIEPNSAITLAATYDGYIFNGNTYTIALGGQDISNSRINRAAKGVSGTYSGTFPFFYECSIGTVSGTPAAFQTCGFTGTFTITAAGDYFLVDCFSQIAGPTNPTIDMGAAVGATNLSVRRWAGGLTLNNLAAGDVVTLDGTFGTVTLNGADATVEIRGTAKNVVNNLTGSPTVNDTTILSTDIDDILTDTSTTIPGLIAALNDISVSDLQNTAMTEGYAAKGAAPTIAQAFHMILSLLAEHAGAGTTLTTKKLDGSTTAMTFTFDDASSPTSITRAT